MVTNRINQFQRASSLVVKVGLEQDHLRIVHDQGGVCFGEDGEPLDIEFPFQRARFVRLELRDREHLHLNQVEVYQGRQPTPVEPPPNTTRAEKRLADLGWTPRFGKRQDEYAWIVSGENPVGELIGVEYHSQSRFGNALMSDMQLLQAAKFLGVANVRLGAHACFRSSFSQTWNGLNVVIGEEQPLVGSGVLLRGHFGDGNNLPGLLQMTPEEEHRSSFELLRNMLDLPPHRRICDPDEYAIHIRSGDIFEDYFHEAYVQPPLAFYKVAIRDALACGDITKVLLVFENRSNPCIDALIAHLQSRSIPYRLQSSTLIDDVSALLDCKHLTFGIGTFGPAISWLSKELTTVRYFYQGFYDPPQLQLDRAPLRLHRQSGSLHETGTMGQPGHEPADDACLSGGRDRSG